MSDACYCDYESPLVYDAQMVTARREHRCGECGRKIVPGERYERVAGLSVDGWYHAKTCAHCIDLREYMTAQVPCFCWAHGALLQDAKDTAEHYSEPGTGLWMGYGRRVVAIDRAAR